MSNLILASSSPYRKSLLERLQIPFRCISPNVDESPLKGEKPYDMVLRLAELKAKTVAKQHSGGWVIGSDQVALFNGKVLTKPGNHANAADQLRLQSGQKVQFFTGLSLCNHAYQQVENDVITTEVTFRELSEQEITDYLNKDQPWNCAGSFKSEGLGISLFNAIDSEDPTALIGLPLIRLCQMLRNANYI